MKIAVKNSSILLQSNLIIFCRFKYYALCSNYFSDKYSEIATKVYSIAREKEKFQVDAIPELEMEDKNKLQRALAVLPKVRANYVLVICRTEHLATIMEKVHLASCYRKLNYQMRKKAIPS